MLLIPCPNCGPRDETEYHYGGQAHVPYPENPSELTDRQWAEYLFYRDNTKGAFAERWLHSTGCRQWFNMLRDTVTYDIQAVYPMGTSRPATAIAHLDALSVVVPNGARKQPDLIEQPGAASGTSAPSISATSITAPEGATK
jgi:sarcosine oxidase subunit delta